MVFLNDIVRIISAIGLIVASLLGAPSHLIIALMIFVVVGFILSVTTLKHKY